MTVNGAPRVLLVMAEASGGIAGHVVDLAHRLTARAVPVAVATTPSSAARLRFDGKVFPVLRSGRSMPSSVRALRRLVGDFDVVHAHGHQAGVQAVLATAGLRSAPPVIITWHNALLAGGAAGVAGAAAERLQVARARLVTGASADLVQRARELRAKNATLTPVAADLTPWSGDPAAAKAELAAAHRLPADRPWVLTVSRIAPQKDLPTLLDASAKVEGAAFVVVGDGDPELTEQLRARIEAEHLPVHLVGASAQVPQFIAASRLLAMPSRWEARPLVVQEALAGGLPCVVTDTGGLPELVGDAGLLVPVGDADALAAGIRRLLDDPDLVTHLSEAGRRRAAQLPDGDQVADDWVQRYRAVCG